jgi:hypothetical protein
VEALSVSEVGERLHVVGLTALEILVVTAQVSATVPENELPGVTVMVEVLLLVAPGATVMLPLLARVKLVELLPLGACQKSPHPASNGAAANSNRAHFPIFIAAPQLLLNGQGRSPVSTHKSIASIRVLSR